MEQSPWLQVNIAYPGRTRQEREQQAVDHLTRVLPGAEKAGLTAWWFMRKGPWRIRYLPTWTCDPDLIHRLLGHGMTWTRDIYEPEIHAFGGPEAMDAAHALFHQDSRHLLAYLQTSPADRRERSLILCTALMRAAGLDLDEQGDVWARAADLRADQPGEPKPNSPIWTNFTRDVRRLLTSTAHCDITKSAWHTAFTDAGHRLRTLRDAGMLTRGLRAVTAKIVIFHWNRIGLPAANQAALAQAAKEAIFGS